MAVKTNFQVTGMGRAERERIAAAIERALAARPGRWRVQFIGAMADEEWEVRISGPATETTIYVAQREPDAIAEEVARTLEA